MPDGSFKKLSIPPRLHERILDPLSLADHAKYLYFHNHCRRVLDTIQRKGGSPRVIEQFGHTADWLRAVDHFVRRWSAPWAFAYIHHTYPAYHWPDDSSRGTVDPLTFAFLWFYGEPTVDLLGSLRFEPLSEYPCLICGRRIGRLDTVLRFGAPSCGCVKRILRPSQACIIVSEDFPHPTLVESFRKRCQQQKVIDPLSAWDSATVTFGFVARRSGFAEAKLKRSMDDARPTFVLGSREYVSTAEDNRPPVGGLAVRRNGGQLG